MIKVKDGKHLKQIIESRPNDADLNCKVIVDLNRIEHEI